LFLPIVIEEIDKNYAYTFDVQRPEDMANGLYVTKLSKSKHESANWQPWIEGQRKPPP